MSLLTILLADDHAIVREGLKALINMHQDMTVIGEASDGCMAWQMAAKCRPDMVIMDISMPTLNGVQATIQLKQVCPAIKVLALSVHDDTSTLRQLLAAGASGYILKHAAADDLIQAIRLVAAGGVYLDPLLAVHVVAGYLGVPDTDSTLLGAHLSERETDVVRRIAEGYTNKEIALQLTLSVKTVETYRARAMEKLGLQGRAALVRYALACGWLHSGPLTIHP